MNSLTFIFAAFAALSFIVSFFYILIQWVFRKRHRLLGRNIILFILLSLLALLAFSMFSYQELSCKNCPYERIIAMNKITDLSISMSSFPSITVDQSTDLHVHVTSLYASDTPSATHTSSNVTSTPLNPVGTPDVPIQEAFGPGYDVFATAQLSASSFDINPTQQAMQSLDQGVVDFVWTITPKYQGPQVLYVTVTGIWIPKSGGPSITRPLGSLAVNIVVESTPTPNENPLLPLGQNFLLTLIGSVLNIPWIWDLIAKRREKKRAKQESMSQTGSVPTQASSNNSSQPQQNNPQQRQGKYGVHPSQPNPKLPPAHHKKSHKKDH